MCTHTIESQRAGWVLNVYKSEGNESNQDRSRSGRPDEVG